MYFFEKDHTSESATVTHTLLIDERSRKKKRDNISEEKLYPTLWVRTQLI